MKMPRTGGRHLWHQDYGSVSARCRCLQEMLFRCQTNKYGSQLGPYYINLSRYNDLVSRDEKHSRYNDKLSRYNEIKKKVIWYGTNWLP